MCILTRPTVEETEVTQTLVSHVDVSAEKQRKHKNASLLTVSYYAVYKTVIQHHIQQYIKYESYLYYFPCYSSAYIYNIAIYKVWQLPLILPMLCFCLYIIEDDYAKWNELVHSPMCAPINHHLL